MPPIVQINSWDRLPYLTEVSGAPSFESVPTHVEENFIFANFGGSQGFDTDDGSSFYHVHHNVMYSADGMKMDYGGHDSSFYSNVVVTTPYDGQVHSHKQKNKTHTPRRLFYPSNPIQSIPDRKVVHPLMVILELIEVMVMPQQNCFDVGQFVPGHGDGYYNNTCVVLGCRNPACVDKVTSVAQCDPSIVTLHSNKYYTTNGNATVVCGGAAYTVGSGALQAKGMEKGSTAGPIPTDEEIIAFARTLIETFETAGKTQAKPLLPKPPATSPLRTMVSIDWRRVADVPAQGPDRQGFQDSDGAWLDDDTVLTAFGYSAGGLNPGGVSGFLNSSWTLNTSKDIPRAEQVWRRLPDAPVSGRQEVAAAKVGDALFFVGGFSYAPPYS